VKRPDEMIFVPVAAVKNIKIAAGRISKIYRNL
jgi:hypothetical protein